MYGAMNQGFKGAMPEPFVIAPVRDQPVNYRAFKNDEVILHLFNGDILEDLKNENVETRKSALSMIHEAIRGCEHHDVLVDHLQKLVMLLMIPMEDSNMKIVLNSLQILQELTDRVDGSSIAGHLDQILSTYLEKIACNKYNIKQNGMKFLTHLMRVVVDPMKVLNVIMEHGLTSRRSKVREETVNIVTIALLQFPEISSSLKRIMEKIVPLLLDTKRSVRQSSLEACAVFVKYLGKDGLQQLVSAVKSIEMKTSNGVDSTDPTTPGPVMKAIEMRLSRNLIPSVNSDGLLNHQVNVTNGKGDSSSDMLTGADVDWIMAGAGKSSSPSATGGRKVSMSGSGPLRSAGKKLPWDATEKPNKPSQTTYSSMYQHQSFSKPVQPPKHKGYLDLYQNRSSVRTSDRLSFQQYSTSHSIMVKEGGHPNGLNDSIVTEETDQLAITWPRSNGYHSSFTKATSRQISADAMTLPTQSKGDNTSLPALVPSRPSSKPIVRNLFPPHSQPAFNPAVEKTLVPSTATPFTLATPTNLHSAASNTEKTFLSRHNEDDNDQDYFNIPMDDSMLNGSLSSSVTSLFGFKEPSSANHHSSNRKKNTSEGSRPIHSRDVSWKIESVSTQCSASTSPVNTPPLIHGPSPQKAQTKKPQTNATSIALKQNNNLPKKLNLTSPNKPRTDSYSRKYNDSLHSTVGGEGMGMTSGSGIEETLNKTFTISPPEKATNKLLNSTKPRNKINSYAEASALRKDTKLLSSPNHDPFTKKTSPIGKKESSLSISNTVSTTVSASFTAGTTTTETDQLTPRKVKKASPSKINTPLRASRRSLSPVNGSACSSAPIYRVGMTSSHQDDIYPHENPDEALKQAFENLNAKSEEWETNCEGLLSIRRLVAFNEQKIIPHLRKTVPLVVSMVGNPRSQVTRAALACLGDMFALLGNAMEPYLDVLLKTILSIGAKSNVFYKEDAEKVLSEMIGRLLPGKCILALSNALMGNKCPQQRRMVSNSLYNTIKQHGAEFILKQLSRDVLEKLLSDMTTLVIDANVGARYYAKLAISELYIHPEFERIVTKMLPTTQSTKLKETAELLKTKGIGKPPPELNPGPPTKSTVRQSANRSAPTRGPTPMKQEATKPTRRRRMSGNGLNDTIGSPGNSEVALPDGLLAKMAGNDWNERNQAITELEAFITSHATELGSNIVKIFDIFNQRLTDQNSKVNLHALESFQRFAPLIGSHLQPVLSTLVESLVRTVASRYPTIHSAAITAMDTLIASIDPSIILAPLASAAINGNARVQPFMLRKLADILPDVSQHKPGQVQRVALPVLWKILSSRAPSTGEAKLALQTLCQSLLLCLGWDKLETAMSQQPPDQQQRLRDILQNMKSSSF